MRSIIVPSGIGDSIWLIQKLINQSEKFDWVLPGSKPQRGKQVFDLLPQITNSAKYSPDPRLTYNLLSKNNIQKKINTWSKIPNRTMHLSANEHLEKGNRIENFFPDLLTSFTIDWKTEQYIQEVDKDIYTIGPLIGIYGSSYSTTRAWNFWKETEWLELIKSINKVKKVTFVLIGAEWDLDLNTGIANELDREKIKYINTIGKPLGYVIELMKRLNYAFYFPSGLPILSETLKEKRDCMMFYPSHLTKMMGTWADPDRIGKNFKEVQFCTPEAVFTYVKNDYKLFDKI